MRNRYRGRRYENDDWAEQVPESRFRGPYRDYGWESGQSSLPEFRDPSIHLTPEEMEEVRDWQRQALERAKQTGQWGRRQGEGRGGYPDEASRQSFWQDRRPSQMREGYFGEPYGREYSPQGYYNEVWGRGFDDEGQFRFDREWTIPGPYAGRGPRNYRRSDDRIHDNVIHRLTQHGQIDAQDIKVDVEDGEVYLWGSVADRRTKRMAEDAIESIPGVMDVHNRLKIQETRGGRGRQDRVGRSGVYPASAGEAPDEAEARGMAGWGQGRRGAAGYEDSGESELPTAEDMGQRRR